MASVALGVYLVVVILGFVLGKVGVPNYLRAASDFIFTPANKIETQAGRTNILVLGKAGAGYTAPDLTDTIIFASVNNDNLSTTLTSLPRDIWIPAIRAKLNSAYYWGGQRQEGGGLTLAKSVVEEIVGQPVHYGVVIDFSGFKKIIDVIGGIEVEVERGFVDEKYPIVGRENDECGGDKEFKCRYETVRFEKGLTQMDGETALKFVRSRNAVGEEGTDLAREARQQKVLVALKNKLLSSQVFLSPKRLLGVIQEIKNSVETDMDVSAGAILTRRIIQSRDSLSSSVIPADLLVNPPILPRYDNQYVFTPKSGDWGEVRDWVACQIGANCPKGK
jgi:LCP family protein required for cell wall assembly